MLYRITKTLCVLSDPPKNAEKDIEFLSVLLYNNYNENSNNDVCILRKAS